MHRTDAGRDRQGIVEGLLPDLAEGVLDAVEMFRAECDNDDPAT